LLDFFLESGNTQLQNFGSATTHMALLPSAQKRHDRCTWSCAAHRVAKCWCECDVMRSCAPAPGIAMRNCKNAVTCDKSFLCIRRPALGPSAQKRHSMCTWSCAAHRVAKCWCECGAVRSCAPAPGIAMRNCKNAVTCDKSFLCILRPH
jgi:hypothetical protein